MRIAATLGGMFIPVVMFVVIFVPENAWILIFIAFAFALLGAILGRYASGKR